MKLDKLSNWILGISGITLVFACFAPLIFTSGSLVDFTDTGQIGDTIGGTMSPIVGIVGSLMTFLAFLMQVRANEIQSQQLGKSFELKMVEDQMNKQLASRDALGLLSIDMHKMVDNVETTCAEMQKFCQATANRPTGDIPLKFVPKYSANRYQTIDRNLLYNAFASFMSADSYKESFGNVFQLMDFYSEGFDIIKDVIYKPYTDEIMSIKRRLPTLEHNLQVAILNLDNTHGDSFNALRNTYFQEIKECLVKNGILDAFFLHKIINDGRFGRIYSYVPNEYEAVLEQSNLLITTNLMFASEIGNTATTWSKDETLGTLKRFIVLVDKTLEENTSEQIRNKYTAR